MIASLLLAALLAATPGPEPAPPQAPVAVKPARLDAPITLRLKDSSLVDLLEKIADLLGVTPILEPGVVGQVSLDLEEIPLSKALVEIGVQTETEITISGKVLRARWKDRARAGAATASPSTLRTGVFGELLRVWIEGAEDRPTAIRVPAYVGTVDLPGCREPVTIAPLGPFSGKAYGVARWPRVTARTDGRWRGSCTVPRRREGSSSCRAAIRSSSPRAATWGARPASWSPAASTWVSLSSPRFAFSK
ncbi:MAG: hypothetical protein IPF66_22405 [Holophagales bacterium]|nr:hypothetical protein [Holophagales bacterium]